MILQNKMENKRAIRSAIVSLTRLVHNDEQSRAFMVTNEIASSLVF